MPRRDYRPKPYGTAVPAKISKPRSKLAPTIVSSGNGRGALPAGIRILANGGRGDVLEAASGQLNGIHTDDPKH